MEEAGPHKSHHEEKIEELIKKEELLKHEQSEKRYNEKEIKNVEKSKTWKASAPLRNVRSFFAKITGRTKALEQEQQIKQLEAKLVETKNQLYETRESLHEATLNQLGIHASEAVQLVKEKSAEGDLLPYIDELVTQKKAKDTNYTNALRYAARRFMNEKEMYKRHVYEKILPSLKVEDIPEFMIRVGLEGENPVALNQLSSFRASLTMRMRQKQLVDSLPEWVVDDKERAYAFMDKLGVRRPWTSPEKYTYANIPEKSGVVIKPVDGAGSRGVYLVYSPTKIVDIKRSTNLMSWDALKESMAEDLASNWVEEDQWSMEELVLEDHEQQIPASDVKFYCFYGNVGLILEISRVPELKYCWWTSDGKRVRTGKYDDDIFKGKGVSPEELEMAKEISLAIPAPFVRIDFLRSRDGLVFGEFTPKPGNYDEFDDPTDKWLGDYFAEAQGRLVQDLLNKKQFADYQAFIKDTTNN